MNATLRSAIAAAVIAPAASAGFTNNILITGYWPPTNEQVRRFSTSPEQNPAGWLGGNWNNTGYDIHSFFPEFPSPPNPPSRWGAGEGDLRVDYQDTMTDWLRIVDEINPAAIITFSRGRSGSNWEIEGQLNMQAPNDWGPDYEAPFRPDASMPIFDGTLIPGETYPSMLPIDAIQADVQAAGIFDEPSDVFIDTAGAGAFLSEFIGLLGTRHQILNAGPDAEFRTFAAGHIHVGINTPEAVATLATERTLGVLTDYLDTVIPTPTTAAPLALAAAALTRRRRNT